MDHVLLVDMLAVGTGEKVEIPERRLGASGAEPMDEAMAYAALDAASMSSHASSGEPRQKRAMEGRIRSVWEIISSNVAAGVGAR